MLSVSALFSLSVRFSHHVVVARGPRQLNWSKAWIRILRIAGLSLTAGGVFFWYGPLASLSKLLAWLWNTTVKLMEVPTSE